MDSINVRVAKRLLEIKAVFLRPQEPFTWASGIKSPIYCDNRLILTAPEARNEVEQAIAMSAKYMRQVRAAVLEELNKDYVLGAAARGVRGRVILWKSVLKSAMLTILTLLALSIGSLLGGTAIIESIFMWDGVGKLAVDAITMRDYPLIQAYVVWMAIIYVMVNLVTDILYHVLDPRIRLGVQAG